MRLIEDASASTSRVIKYQHDGTSPEKAAAFVALRRMKVLLHIVIQEDWDDMSQEAALAIALNQGKGEKYAFSCGVNAAAKWWLEFIWGYKSHKKHVTEADTRLSDSVSLELIGEDERETFAKHTVSAEPRDALTDDQIKKMVGVFMAARKRGGQRSVDAAMHELLHLYAPAITMPASHKNLALMLSA